MHLNPAEYVVYVFKGVRKAGLALGRSAAAVSKWNKSKKNKGSGGRIPSVAQLSILKVAKKRGLDITPEDLVIGREVKE